MQALFMITLLCLVSFSSVSQALIDRDVLAQIHEHGFTKKQDDSIAILIFLKSRTHTTLFLEELNAIPGVVAKPLNFMSAVTAIIPKDWALVYQIANHPAIAQISSNRAGAEELEVSTQAILLAPSNTYPSINNWWRQGYTGQHGVLGLIDSGVAVEHPGLLNKTIVVRQEPDSEYSRYLGGVRSAHATGAACIYAGVGSGSFSRERGIAYGVSTILTGLAGEGTGEKEDLLLTMTTLDWMLTRAPVRPTVINYSFGNGLIGCAVCSDWSGLAKVVDYVVNHEKIMWVKSAGNQGFTEPAHHLPYPSTMTAPADNYNAITVANMNPTIVQQGVAYQTSDRSQHTIRYTSSRGPTLYGRKKPDISAPGNDTRTCAPEPHAYQLHYTLSMDFHDGYRLMGGTSSAAPHVGGAVLLLQEAGIRNPMAAKALLINSADAWTDSGKPSPDDPNYVYTGGHFPVMGSEWNPSYGWGYLNMQQAFEQRNNIMEDSLTLNHPVQEFQVTLPVGGKVTLVHERRVGYLLDNTEWRLSPLSLELYDANTNQLIASDHSLIDSVHQVANCDRQPGEKKCSSHVTARRVTIRVTLLSSVLDGSTSEPFALVYG